jgi:hypothetical protein
MDDHLGTGLFDGQSEAFPVAQANRHKTRPRIHRGPMSFAQIIQDRNYVTCLEKFFHAHGADIAGSSSDYSVHELKTIIVVARDAKLKEPRLKETDDEAAGIIVRQAIA